MALGSCFYSVHDLGKSGIPSVRSYKLLDDALVVKKQDLHPVLTTLFSCVLAPSLIYISAKVHLLAVNRQKFGLLLLLHVAI